MHVLISCVGSAGDVHPFIAIGQCLKQRGHRVEVLTSPYFRDRIEMAGLGFVPIGTLADYETAVRNADLWHPWRSFTVVWRTIEENLREGYQQIAQRAETDSVLVGSTLAFNSRLAQEKMGLPGATVHLSPSCLFSAYAPARWPGLGWLHHLPRALIGGILNAVEGIALDPVILPDLNRYRFEMDLPPTRHVMSHWLNSPQRVICAFPTWFATPQPDWPPNSTSTDFVRWRGREDAVLDPALAGFLESGTPPVGITPGSSMAHGRPIFERALAACAALNVRAVIVTPYRDQLPARLPPWAMHVNYAPFELLLPYLAALVHHGGIGTAAECLASGVPQLITPWAYDQFDNAARLVQLRVAKSILPRANPRTFISALNRLINDTAVRVRCRELARKLRDDIPARTRIAELIEQLRG